MKKILSVLVLIFCLSIASYAQVGIGINTPEPSAQLDVSSTERGFLPPRMTSAQRDLIAAPATGLLIFQTDNTAGYYYYNGTAWVNLGAMGAAGTNGTNGLNTLIKTTTEAAGANCANGGTKIETGLDANGNGVLEVGEINSNFTAYTCNGSVSNSFTPVYGIKQGFSSSTNWTCPNGVTQIQVELWSGAGGAGGRAGFRCGNTSGGSCVSGCASPLGGRKGGDGGKGGYIKQIISVVPGQSYPIIIGQGGLAGGQGSDGSSSYCVTNHPACNGLSGSNGGTTSFGSVLNINGGTGGTGGTMTYPSGQYITAYGSCDSPNGQGINGLNGSIINYTYPSQSNGIRSYLPTGYVTDFPGSTSSGGVSYSYVINNIAPAAANAGENGYCIITY